MRRPSVPPASSASAAPSRLGDGVDQVRAHRVAAVDEEVDDDAARRRGRARDRGRARRRRARPGRGSARVGEREELGARGAGCARTAAVGVGDVVTSICAIISGSVDARRRSRRRARDALGGVRGGGDDARLLDRHRHEVIARR